MSVAQSLRNRLSFMRGNILIMTLTRVLGMFCRSMVFPYASLYILALGGEPAQIGFVSSLRPLAGLLIFPIAGYLADLTGRVKLIALAGFLQSAVLMLYVLAPSWEVIAVAGLLQGFMVFQFPASSAIVADSLDPRTRGKGIATMDMLAGALAVFSPYLAGAVLEFYDVEMGMRILYGVLMVASLVSAAINLRFLKETSSQAIDSVRLGDLPRALKSAYSGIPAMLRRWPRSLKAMAVVIILAFMANAISGPFWVVYAVQQIGLESTEWGLILLIQTLLRNIVCIPAGMVVDRYGRTKFLMLALLVALLPMSLFVLSTNLTQVVLVRAAIAITNALFSPACSALLADIVPREIRGRVMSAIGRGTVMLGTSGEGTGGPGMGFLTTLPVMLSSILGGYLYARNPTYPWLFAAVITSIAVIVAALFIRDPQQAEA